MEKNNGLIVFGNRCQRIVMSCTPSLAIAELLRRGYESDVSALIGSATNESSNRVPGGEKQTEVTEDGGCTVSTIAKRLIDIGSVRKNSYYQAVDLQEVSAAATTYVSLLRKCTQRKALDEGKCIHCHIVKHGLNENLAVGNELILMYTKCESIIDARQVFDNMPCRNIISWSVMIAGYGRHGNSQEAFNLFLLMEQEGLKPDKVAFINVLNSCASPEAVPLGKLIHAHIVDLKFESDVVVANTLINMYGKCINISNARNIFDKMLKRNVVSWNTMIGCYAKHGNGEEAFNLFWQMQQEGVKPDKITFINILNACLTPEFLSLGKLFHAHILDGGFESDLVVGTALLHMYGKCERNMDAWRVFNKMTERNIVSWNTMIATYAQHEYCEEAFNLFQQMQREGVKPDKITFTNILKTCSNAKALALGRLFHACILDMKLESDLVVANSLVNMYGKCVSVKDACRMFEKMPARNVVSWNMMIGIYGQYGHGQDAARLFQQMQQEGMKQDEVTFGSILSACANTEHLCLGKLVHAYIIDNAADSGVVENALLTMYWKCGSIEDTWRMFNKMADRNVASWNVMIAACSQHGFCKEALILFQQMHREGMVPSEVTCVSLINVCAHSKSFALGKLIHAFIVAGGIKSIIIANALISMYGKCGSIRDARKTFDEMPVHDVVAWTALVAAHAQHGYGKEAFRFYKEMQQGGVPPDRVTFISILNACSSPESLALGKLVHKDIAATGFESDPVVRISLLNMYAKCGSIENARMTFDNTPKQDVFSWSAMIAAYAQNGHSDEALQVFEEMQREGLKPDKITMISVLNACSYAGLVDEGFCYFNLMIQDHGITPTVEHYNCMVDLLGRAGQMDEAEEFIYKMPFQPDAVIWITLLGSCRIHGCIDHGKHAAEQALQLDPELPPAYIMLSHLYAAAGRWDDEAKS